MNKKIIISIVIIAIIAVVYFFVYQKAQAPTPKDQAATVSTEAQASVSSGVDKANPFNVNVNPYQGYKNPFQ